MLNKGKEDENFILLRVSSHSLYFHFLCNLEECSFAVKDLFVLLKRKWQMGVTTSILSLCNQGKYLILAANIYLSH